MIHREKEFECIGKSCNSCCEDPLTPIELTLGDIVRIASFTNMNPNDFIDRYIEFTPFTRFYKILSISENIHSLYTYQMSLIFPCRFWNRGCTVYDSRPILCSLFPYEIIKNKRETGGDVLLEYNQYFDFPCMRASKLSDNQLNFLRKVKPIAERERDISLSILKEYGLIAIKKFDDLPEVASSEEFKEIYKKIERYKKEKKKKEFLETQKLLFKKQHEIIKNHVIGDFGFNPKEKLKEVFSEENLKYLFEPTSKYYLNLLSIYDNKL